MPKSTTVSEGTAKYKPNVQFMAEIRGLYYTMNFMGLWPWTSWRKCYKFIWCVQTIGLVFQIFGPIADLIVRTHDRKEVIESLGVLIPMVCVFVKWLTLTTRPKSIKAILCSLEEDWISLERSDSVNRRVRDGKQIMSTYSGFVGKFLLFYGVTLMFAVGNYVEESIAARSSSNNVTGLSKLFLLADSWFPVDYDRGFNLEILTVTQTITTATFYVANAAIDGLFIAAILHLCGQFKILRHFIENITCDPSKPDSCDKEVKLIVKRHQVLLSLGDRLQNTFNFYILEQLLAIVFALCVLTYRILLEMQSFNGVTSVLLESGFLCAASLQMIFAFCLVGDHLSNQSIAIAKAIYNVQWYNCSRSINLVFSIVIIRARRPVEITGGNLLAMSLENFTVIMKATASYISVLRALV